MSFFRVTPAELRAKAGELRNLNSQFKSRTDELESQEQLLGSKWEGESKEAFHVAFTNDKIQMDNFYNLIEQYCQALENNAAEYEKAEEKAVQITLN